jgi:ABC-type multidrug transport system ATPase subunit
VREFSDLSATPAERRQVERIELDKVSFAYDEQEVLSGLSLRLDPGETVLLSGRNGSGKTTLAQVVAGLLQPTAGAASVHSLDYISLAPFPPVFIPGDVRTNVGYDKLPPKSQEVVLTLAQEFELEEKLDVDPNELSAGQKQKASIIRALSKDASLDIFDEPLANIDVQTRQLVLRRILELTRGKTVVIVMHSEGEFNHFFDRVINLSPASAATAETALA